jgi:hypothetical protein
MTVLPTSVGHVHAFGAEIGFRAGARRGRMSAKSPRAITGAPLRSSSCASPIAANIAGLPELLPQTRAHAFAAPDRLFSRETRF